MLEDTSESGVQSGDTSVTDESVSHTEPSEAASQEAVETKPQPEEKPAPFHEHPRFKEVIEQNRSFREEMSRRNEAFENLQRELMALKEASKPKSEPVKDPFIADLEKINPAYAKSLESVYQRASKAEELERRFQQMESQQFAEKAYSHFDNLLKSNKVTDSMEQTIYKAAVEAEVFRRESQGKKLGLKDLDSIFNEFHTKYAKAMEDRDRTRLKGYVKEKASDKTPSGATGGAPAAAGAKKLKAGDISGQAKWLADQIRGMKKEH